jgi:hypothetical protein
MDSLKTKETLRIGLFLSVQDKKNLEPLIYLGWAMISAPEWQHRAEIFMYILGGKLIYTTHRNLVSFEQKGGRAYSVYWLLQATC